MVPLWPPSWGGINILLLMFDCSFMSATPFLEGADQYRLLSAGVPQGRGGGSMQEGQQRVPGSRVGCMTTGRLFCCETFFYKYKGEKPNDELFTPSR